MIFNIAEGYLTVTNTLMPGRALAIGVVGRALISKVRISNPLLLRVARHVAKSGMTELAYTLKRALIGLPLSVSAGNSPSNS